VWWKILRYFSRYKPKIALKEEKNDDGESCFISRLASPIFGDQIIKVLVDVTVFWIVDVKTSQQRLEVVKNVVEKDPKILIIFDADHYVEIYRKRSTSKIQ
jgi:hypothetical protein